MKSLSGAWFKVRYHNGAYLGVIAVPDVVAMALEKYGKTRGFKAPLLPAMWPAERNISPAPVFHEFYIVQSHYFDGDAIALYGITVEQISAESGFAFLPSAEYLRRPVEVSAPVELKPVPSGKHLAAAREVAGL